MRFTCTLFIIDGLFSSVPGIRQCLLLAHAGGLLLQQSEGTQGGHHERLWLTLLRIPPLPRMRAHIHEDTRRLGDSIHL